MTNPLPPPSRPTRDLEEGALEVHLDPGRDGWAVFSLSGPFTARHTVDKVGRALLDALIDNHPVAVIDATRAIALAPGMLGTFVSAGRLFAQCEGLVVVTGLDPHDAARLRDIDEPHLLDVL